MKKIISLVLIFSINIISIYSQNNVEQTIYSELEKYDFYNDYEYESIKKHELQTFLLTDNKKIIISFTTSEYHSGHRQGAYMSIFILSKSNNSWQINEKFLKAEEEVGSYGYGPSKEDIKVFSINNKFMITIKSGFMNQGSGEEYIRCFYPISDEIKNVGTITILVNSEASLLDADEIENWEAQYFFLPTDNSLPQILLNITGEKGGITFYKTEYYYFNGKKYVLKK